MVIFHSRVANLPYVDRTPAMILTDSPTAYQLRTENKSDSLSPDARGVLIHRNNNTTPSCKVSAESLLEPMLSFRNDTCSISAINKKGEPSLGCTPKICAGRLGEPRALNAHFEVPRGIVPKIFSSRLVHL
jgi:hypothetical protein